MTSDTPPTTGSSRNSPPSARPRLYRNSARPSYVSSRAHHQVSRPCLTARVAIVTWTSEVGGGGAINVEDDGGGGVVFIVIGEFLSSRRSSSSLKWSGTQGRRSYQRRP
ncbi:biphenyl dioxygenase ferredoxin subunit [Striga asiatica]|uniref:Biphenyl dioxygenase ferredoxin subunit n=1 Tax=Striga asiatica TaxID=4170 RepID=A0A5A7R175_STRAF|nr:biphenyl dioxygenase ferredoxin subunit [Striga asiatica]